ncbi:hypothetical protein DBR40_01025 [Pedobacter sp. KBW01]|uniref:hypothetical protein n=1 Tax=Pedobacter sp. KBW01 TaxID=2153364 RepID=UPI000F590785|nr:hypothetical protein [Pedobacter sp. KBW01]RQO80231.1 hypothetical protein DBR40_01025 [Pedobacter sp. KBW01]
MKKIIFTGAFITTACIVNAQETLQTVTERGYTTVKNVENAIIVQEASSGNNIQLYQQAGTSYLLAGKTNGTPNQRLAVYTGGAERLSVLAGGYTGIGTTAPTTKLEVSTGTNYDQLGLTKNTVEYYKGAGVIFRNLVDDGTTTEIGGVQARLLNGSTGNVEGSLSFYTKSYSAKVEAVTIKSNGDMGIGTTNPTEKLAVNGKIRAKEIKVEATNWPDYVFEEGYKVGTLEKLESYIKANKHLPGMQTAKQIETDGLELGEMVKQLLKNQEELTLHLIKIEKENKQLKKACSKMRREMNDIKTKNKI